MTHYPEFVENRKYLEMDSSVPEREQLWAMLNNLTRIHLLTADKFNSFDSLIREYLISGCEVFGLETGIVSEVTSAGNYIVKDVVSPLDVLEKGQEFALDDTYCREVIKSRTVLGFPEVGRLDYMNCHPVYQNLKLEAYLSAPIFVDGNLYGTLNFTSTQPRYKGFSSHERDLITLMANAIGNFILLRQKEAKLVNLNKRIKKFAGYVAHDLRNPIGSIIGLAQMGTKPTTSDKRRISILEKILPTATTALEFVNSLLENAALSSGKISPKLTINNPATLLQSAATKVTALLEESHNSVEYNHTHTSMVSCDSDRIQQALVNLLTNAAKYSPENTPIQIATYDSNDKTAIEIKNTVAAKHKLSANEQHNTSVYGSTGFGLDIVNEILDVHGSTLTIQNDGETYTALFYLQAVTPQKQH